LAGCRSSQPPSSDLTRPSSLIPHPASLIFSDASEQARINFRHTNGGFGKKYFPEMMGSGAAWFDYDNDGDLDLYLVNGQWLTVHGSNHRQPANVLYRNNGDGIFTDVTSQSGLGDTGYGMGVGVGDYDNDGDADVYVTNFGTSRLYRNNGNGTFADVTEQARAGVKGFASSAAFLDYDKDGFLDLYVCRYVRYDIEHDIVCLNPAGKKQYCEINAYEGDDDVLFRNNGRGAFTDVSKQAGILGKRGRGLALVCGDFDNDGDTDIFVANDMSGNLFWRNNGNGTFSEDALTSGVQCDENGRPPAGMGADVADYDLDGDFDLHVSNYQFSPNLLFRNEGNGIFRDATAESGLSEPTVRFLGFGLGFYDFNLDGSPDIFVANGHVIDDVEQFNKDARYRQTPQLFLNDGQGKFKEVSRQAGAPFQVRRVGRGVAFGDYDNDGDVDFLMTVNNGKPVLFRNDIRNGTASVPSFLTIKLIGTKTHRDAVGSRVEVMSGQKRQIAEVRSGNSYLSHSDLRLNFGLGQQTKVDWVRVRWLSGKVQEFRDEKARQFLTVVEGKGIVRRSAPLPAVTTSQ
jgi:hypothetical protein